MTVNDARTLLITVLPRGSVRTKIAKLLKSTMLAVALAVIVTACSHEKITPPDANVQSQRLFEVAMQNMAAKKYDSAVTLMYTLINTYPDSPYVGRAKLALDDCSRHDECADIRAQVEALPNGGGPTFYPSMPAPVATGNFEVYCDGVGIYLAKIDGAPWPGKLVLFSEVSFPPGTLGGGHFGQGQWSHIAVFRDGCVPDGKCDSIADGRVWIDGQDIQDAPPKHISGKYDIHLKGKYLQGTFLAKRQVREPALRFCM